MLSFSRSTVSNFVQRLFLIKFHIEKEKWVNVVIRSVLVSPLVGRDSFVCVLIRIACFSTHEIQIRILSLNSFSPPPFIDVERVCKVFLLCRLNILF